VTLLAHFEEDADDGQLLSVVLRSIDQLVHKVELDIILDTFNFVLRARVEVQVIYLVL
jgi:hypothetical protein